MEGQGLLQALHNTTLHPIPAAYVKVYAQEAGGQHWFYKDGYTDRRGKFDYVGLTSMEDVKRAVRFAVMVSGADGLGAVTAEAKAPPRQ